MSSSYQSELSSTLKPLSEPSIDKAQDVFMETKPPKCLFCCLFDSPFLILCPVKRILSSLPCVNLAFHMFVQVFNLYQNLYVLSSSELIFLKLRISDSNNTKALDDTTQKLWMNGRKGKDYKEILDHSSQLSLLLSYHNTLCTFPSTYDRV